MGKKNSRVVAARSTTAKAYTRKEIKKGFQRSPERFDSVEPDWGLRKSDVSALDIAVDLLLDEFEDDFQSLRDALPPNRSDLYTDSFCKRYLDNFANLATRLRSGDSFHLRAVADELAFYMILNEAQELYVEEHGERSEELIAFYEGLNQDCDFEMLYNSTLDGVETDTLLVSRAGISKLEFSRWFDWFDNVEQLRAQVARFSASAAECAQRRSLSFRQALAAVG